MKAEFLGESLIFVICQPRAGSTMLQRMLAGHSLIQTSAEPWLMLHPIYALKREGIQTEYNAKWAHNALEDFLNYYGDGKKTYFQSIRAFANVLYGRALDGKEAKYFLDKTPRYYLVISELHQIFPEAKFIFLVRNPLAVLHSILVSWVIPIGWHWLSTHRDDLLSAPRSILSGIELLGNSSLVIHYEDLVKRPEELTECICKFLDIDFDPAIINYGDNDMPKGRMGDTLGIQRYRKPSTDSIDRWFSLLEADQTRHLAASYLRLLGSEVVEQLGYSYRELAERVGAGQSIPSASVVPWDIAIRPMKTWSREERLIFNRAMAIQQSGYIPGTISFVKDNFRSLVRSILPFG